MFLFTKTFPNPPPFFSTHQFLKPSLLLQLLGCKHLSERSFLSITCMIQAQLIFTTPLPAAGESPSRRLSPLRRPPLLAAPGRVPYRVRHKTRKQDEAEAGVQPRHGVKARWMEIKARHFAYSKAHWRSFPGGRAESLKFLKGDTTSGTLPTRTTTGAR